MHQQRLTDSRIANLGARAIYESFETYISEFGEITRRAKSRFEKREWRQLQEDSTERLSIYKSTVDKVVNDIRGLLEDRLLDKLIWSGMKAVYSGLIDGRNDWELAETYFNSVTRRIFTTVGVDPNVEFVDTDFDTPPTKSEELIYHILRGAKRPEAFLRDILSMYPFDTPYEDFERDLKLAATRIETHLRKMNALKVLDRAELVKSVFYRGQSAFIVGRVFSGVHVFPLVFSFLNTPEGLVLDALLLDEDDVSILFSFTRSYFFVEVTRPYDLVMFLKKVMPRKRVAELYISIGHNKHGKTALYRDLLEYIKNSSDKFEIARGKRGMVMIVFNLPGYDLVFKLIKDRFDYPKTGTRQTVIQKYHLVFRHDRAGRLVDAQEFEYLKFERSRFQPELLDELLEVASNTVSAQGDDVIINHCYIERRLIPLDVYIEEATEDAALHAVIDYGNSIKDMAATNIFPGDMMLKNFGVTRHGRVIFYDYDELCLLTTCHFRAVPKPRSYEDSISAQPWFSIGENDVFPEEFRHFMGLTGIFEEAFMAKHADLLTVEYWQEIQDRIRRGEQLLILPYDEKNRLKNLAT
jgi:isocitrate dehydrogenase kinase/phosphatase